MGRRFARFRESIVSARRPSSVTGLRRFSTSDALIAAGHSRWEAFPPSSWHARGRRAAGSTLRDARWARRRLAMNPRLDDFWRRDALEAILHDGEAISIEHGG